MKGTHFTSAIAILAAIALTPAHAADPNTSPKGASGAAPSSADAKFAKKAAMDNLAEVALADVARQQASQDTVKQYAEKLRSDHEQATEKLKSIAAQKGIDLPTDVDAKHKREQDKLAKKQGADFDKAYIDSMIKDHKSTIKEFEHEAKSGKDPELKEFANGMLPGLRKHLQEAQQLQGSAKSAKKTS